MYERPARQKTASGRKPAGSPCVSGRHHYGVLGQTTGRKGDALDDKWMTSKTRKVKKGSTVWKVQTGGSGYRANRVQDSTKSSQDLDVSQRKQVSRDYSERVRRRNQRHEGLSVLKASNSRSFRRNEVKAEKQVIKKLTNLVKRIEFSIPHIDTLNERCTKPDINFDDVSKLPIDEANRPQTKVPATFEVPTGKAHLGSTADPCQSARHSHRSIWTIDEPCNSGQSSRHNVGDEQRPTGSRDDSISRLEQRFQIKERHLGENCHPNWQQYEAVHATGSSKAGKKSEKVRGHTSVPKLSLKRTREYQTADPTFHEHTALAGGHQQSLKTFKNMPGSAKDLGLAARMILMQPEARIARDDVNTSEDRFISKKASRSSREGLNPSGLQGTGDDMSIINVFLSRYMSDRPSAQRARPFHRFHSTRQEGESSSNVLSVNRSCRNVSAPDTAIGADSDQNRFSDEKGSHLYHDRSDGASIVSEDLSRNAYFARELCRAESPSLITTVPQTQSRCQTWEQEDHSGERSNVGDHENCDKYGTRPGESNQRREMHKYGSSGSIEAFRPDHYLLSGKDCTQADAVENFGTEEVESSGNKIEGRPTNGMGYYVAGGAERLSVELNTSNHQKEGPDGYEMCKGSHDGYHTPLMSVPENVESVAAEPLTGSTGLGACKVGEAGVRGDNLAGLKSKGGIQACEEEGKRFSPTVLKQALQLEMERLDVLADVDRNLSEISQSRRIAFSETVANKLNWIAKQQRENEAAEAQEKQAKPQEEETTVRLREDEIHAIKELVKDRIQKSEVAEAKDVEHKGKDDQSPSMDMSQNVVSSGRETSSKDASTSTDEQLGSTMNDGDWRMVAAKDAPSEAMEEIDCIKAARPIPRSGLSLSAYGPEGSSAFQLEISPSKSCGRIAHIQACQNEEISLSQCDQMRCMHLLKMKEEKLKHLEDEATSLKLEISAILNFLESKSRWTTSDSSAGVPGNIVLCAPPEPRRSEEMVHEILPREGLSKVAPGVHEEDPSVRDEIGASSRMDTCKGDFKHESVGLLHDKSDDGESPEAEHAAPCDRKVIGDQTSDIFGQNQFLSPSGGDVWSVVAPARKIVDSAFLVGGTPAPSSILVAETELPGSPVQSNSVESIKTESVCKTSVSGSSKSLEQLRSVRGEEDIVDRSELMSTQTYPISSGKDCEEKKVVGDVGDVNTRLAVEAVQVSEDESSEAASVEESYQWETGSVDHQMESIARPSLDDLKQDSAGKMVEAPATAYQGSQDFDISVGESCLMGERVIVEDSGRDLASVICEPSGKFEGDALSDAGLSDTGDIVDGRASDYPRRLEPLMEKTDDECMQLERPIFVKSPEIGASLVQNLSSHMLEESTRELGRVLSSSSEDEGGAVEEKLGCSISEDRKVEEGYLGGFVLNKGEDNVDRVDRGDLISEREREVDVGRVKRFEDEEVCGKDDGSSGLLDLNRKDSGEGEMDVEGEERDEAAIDTCGGGDRSLVVLESSDESCVEDNLDREGSDAEQFIDSLKGSSGECQKLSGSSETASEVPSEGAALGWDDGEVDCVRYDDLHQVCSSSEALVGGEVRRAESVYSRMQENVEVGCEDSFRLGDREVKEAGGLEGRTEAAEVVEVENLTGGEECEMLSGGEQLSSKNLEGSEVCGKRSGIQNIQIGGVEDQVMRCDLDAPSFVESPKSCPEGRKMSVECGDEDEAMGVLVAKEWKGGKESGQEEDSGSDSEGSIPEEIIDSSSGSSSYEYCHGTVGESCEGIYAKVSPGIEPSEMKCAPFPNAVDGGEPELLVDDKEDLHRSVCVGDEAQEESKENRMGEEEAQDQRKGMSPFPMSCDSHLGSVCDPALDTEITEREEASEIQNQCRVLPCESTGEMGRGLLSEVPDIVGKTRDDGVDSCQPRELTSASGQVESGVSGVHAQEEGVKDDSSDSTGQSSVTGDLEFSLSEVGSESYSCEFSQSEDEKAYAFAIAPTNDIEPDSMSDIMISQFPTSCHDVVDESVSLTHGVDGLNPSLRHPKKLQPLADPPCLTKFPESDKNDDGQGQRDVNSSCEGLTGIDEECKDRLPSVLRGNGESTSSSTSSVLEESNLIENAFMEDLDDFPFMEIEDGKKGDHSQASVDSEEFELTDPGDLEDIEVGLVDIKKVMPGNRSPLSDVTQGPQMDVDAILDMEDGSVENVGEDFDISLADYVVPVQEHKPTGKPRLNGDRIDSFASNCTAHIQDDCEYVEKYVANLMQGSEMPLDKDPSDMSYRDGPISLNTFLHLEEVQCNSEQQAEFNLAIFEATNEVLLELLGSSPMAKRILGGENMPSPTIQQLIEHVQSRIVRDITGPQKSVGELLKEDYLLRSKLRQGRA